MTPENDLVMGIDASTTACKAILWDLQGRPLALGRASVPMLTPRVGWHEQSAGDWWNGFQNAVQTASAQIDPERLRAICICAQRETFVPVDKFGQPLRNAILWMDDRARVQLPVIEAAIGLEQFHKMTGKPLSTNLTLPKILWLRENEPEIFENTAKFLDPAAYLNHCLTGEYITGWGMADPTGMFDMRKNQWSPLILDFLGLKKNQLPSALPAGADIGRVTPEAAAACHLPPGLPVIVGLGDGQAAGLGANITRSGQAYLSLGTSIVAGTYSQHYLTDRAFRSMYAADEAFSLETVLLGGTFTLDWLREKFGCGISFLELEIASEEIAPGAEGLIVAPYWNSVMNPYWDANASGITIGWRSHHGIAHFYRAILEGVAYELRLHFEGVEEALKQKIERIIAIGGGAQSELWCQIIADVSGKNIQQAQISEATALGAGILAASGARLFPDVYAAAMNMSHLPRKQFMPNSAQSQIYTRLYDQVYKPLFPTLQGILRRLNDTP